MLLRCVFATLLLSLASAAVVPYPSSLDGLQAAINRGLVEEAADSLKNILSLVDVSTHLKTIKEEVIDDIKDRNQLIDQLSSLPGVKSCLDSEQDLLGNCARCVMDTCASHLVSSCPFELVEQKIVEALDKEEFPKPTTMQGKLFHQSNDTEQELEAMITVIDQVHKEVNNIYSSVILQLVPDLPPILGAHDDLAKRFNISSQTITEVFHWLLNLNVDEAKAVYLNLDSGNELRENIDILVERMQKDQILTSDDFDNVAGNFEENKSLLDTAVDIAGDVWDKTKEISSKAACAVTSVFFKSKCKSRSKRNVETCDFNNILENVEFCSRVVDCTDCDMFSTTDCGANLHGPLHVQYAQLLHQISPTINNILEKRYGKYQSELMRVQNMYSENLWIAPFANILKTAPEPIKVNSLQYDPEEFFQDRQQVYYKNVKMLIVGAFDEPSQLTKPVTTILSLPPVDVHNMTSVASATVQSFVAYYRDLNSVKDEVNQLIGTQRVN